MADSPNGTVLAEIVAERARQDRDWGGAEHDDTHDTPAWLDFLERQVHKSRPLTGRYRERLVKIAALAIAAAESYDRVTAGLDGEEDAERRK